MKAATHCVMCGEPLPPRSRLWQRLIDWIAVPPPPTCRDSDACFDRFLRRVG